MELENYKPTLRTTYVMTWPCGLFAGLPTRDILLTVGSLCVRLSVRLHIQ